MLELRKDIFADERDDNLKEIGKPTQRQDMLGHVTATSTYFTDLLQGMLHLKVLRSPTPTHASAGSMSPRLSASRACRISGRRYPAQPQHAFEPDQLRRGRRADPRRRQNPLQGRAHSRHRRRQRAPGRGLGEDPRRLRAPADRLRRRGGDEAGRAGGQRDLSEEHLHLSRRLRPLESFAAIARAGLRRRRPHSRTALSGQSPIEHAPTETNGSIAAPDTNRRCVVYTSTQALFFSLDTCAKTLTCSNKLHFIGGTVGVIAKAIPSPSRSRSSARC